MVYVDSEITKVTQSAFEKTVIQELKCLRNKVEGPRISGHGHKGTGDMLYA